MNVLYIKLSNGFMITHCRVDQAYGDGADLTALAQNIANPIIAEHHPGATITDIAVADGKAMGDFIQAERDGGRPDFSIDDFEIREAVNARGNAGRGFARSEDVLNDLPDTKKVLYAPPGP